VRSYTPISSDLTPGYFDLLIKSYPTGNISKHVASLMVGQTMKVRGPKGAMVYKPNMVRHFGMIAGGTGITPMLQIIRAIVRGRPTGDTTQVDLLFANVNPEDILLKEDLDALVAGDSGFRVHYVLNNPPKGWKGGVGFVTTDMIKVSLSLGNSRVGANREIGQIPDPGKGRQGPHLRPAAHGQRHEEGDRVPRFSESEAGQQARGPGLLLLGNCCTNPGTYHTREPTLARVSCRRIAEHILT
jgi:hypothetical protein